MTDSTVFVIDDDDAVRDGIAVLLESAGFAAKTYGSAEEFLSALDPARPGCLLLDLNLPGKNGLQLQSELRLRGVRVPIIFLTAHGDVRTAVQAIKGDAIDYLAKPIDGAVLLAQVRKALEIDRDARVQERERATLTEALAELSQRERAVLALAVTGLPNKEIARRLAISHRTVEVYRSRILLKTGAASLLSLVTLAHARGLSLE